MKHRELIVALEKHYKTDVLYCKGSFLIRGKPPISMAKARRITGIEGEKRKPRTQLLPWGDYATIAMLNKRG